MRQALSRTFVAIALISSVLALLIVFGQNDGAQAGKFGLSPVAGGVLGGHPLDGTRLGTNLCQVDITWSNPSGPDIDFEDAVDGGGDKDFTGRCNNSTTNTPLASPATITENSFDRPRSNFSSLVAFTPEGAFIAPGPGNTAFDAALHPPLGAVMGTVVSDLTVLSIEISGAGTACGQEIPVEFSMLNGTLDTTTFLPSTSAGSITSAAGDTMTVTSITGAVEGRGLKITGGKGAGQGRYITGIAGSVITVDRVWEVPPDTTSTYEITNLIYPKTPGISIHLNPLAESDPAGADGVFGNADDDLLPLHVTRYPSYLLELFDPDLLHPRLNDFDPSGGGIRAEQNNWDGGTDKDPLTPLARYTGRQLVVGDDIILEVIVFDKVGGNALKEFNSLVNHPWAQIGENWGYPSVTVLIDPTVPASPSPIQDFCTPLGSSTVLLGDALENQSGTVSCTDSTDDALSCLNTPPTTTQVAQCTGAVDCGPRYKNPDSGKGLLGGNTNLFIGWSAGFRDVDDDGITNPIDACPYDAQVFGVDWSDTTGDNGGPRVKDLDVGGRQSTGSNSSNTLNDTLIDFVAAGVLSGDDVAIVSGFASGQIKEIDTVTTNTLTIVGSWTAGQPNATSFYQTSDGIWDDDNDGLPNPCDLGTDPGTGLSSTVIKQGNKDKMVSVTSTITSAEILGSQSLTDTNSTFTGTEHVGRVAVTPQGGSRLILSHTSDTLTVDRPWNGALTINSSYEIINEAFSNRQDNCPSSSNPAQFEDESIPDITLEPDFPEDGGTRTDGIGNVCDLNPNTADGHYHTEVIFYPVCITNDVPTNDTDGDGWCNTTESAAGTNNDSLGSLPADASSTPEGLYLDIAWGLVRQQAGARPWVTNSATSSLVGDGIAAYTGTMTSADATSITDSSNPFPADGSLVGGSVEAGSQIKTIVSHTASKINIDAGSPFSPTPSGAYSVFALTTSTASGVVHDNAHPDTGEPVSGLPRPCSNGFDDSGDGNADRNDANCKLLALTTFMKTDATFGLDNILGDEDSDGDPTWIEILRGTDPFSRCPKAGPSNELLDAWYLDTNDDGSVNIFDVVGLFAYWLTSEADNDFSYRADINLDGQVNIFDVVPMFGNWLDNLFDSGSTPPWAC